MKIAILNESKQSLGGGWSFIDNFIKGMAKTDHEVVGVEAGNPEVILVPSSSMAKPESALRLQSQGKKVVLRVDNIPRNSRNRGAGTTRLYSIAQFADGIVYQSKWAKDYIQSFIKRDGAIIYNGVDTEVFHEDKKDGFKDFGNFDEVYLYSRYNRDETKRWEQVWYDYQMIHRAAKAEGRSTKLVIVGRFSDELRQYDFDFYNGEKFEYIGTIDDPKQMAQVYRGCNTLLAPYYNDAYSNTIQEALACGLKLKVNMSGGTEELVYNGVITKEKMVNNYVKYFNELLS